MLQLLTVPYLIDNPEVGYVQTRWVFANPDESYLTKVCHWAHALLCRKACIISSNLLCWYNVTHWGIPCCALLHS